MWGTKVASKTATGAAAGSLLTSKTRVEVVDEYVVVERLAERGWMELEKVGFKATGDGGEDAGVGIDDFSYAVRIEAGCEGGNGGGQGIKPEVVGMKMGGLGKGKKWHRRRIRKM